MMHLLKPKHRLFVDKYFELQMDGTQAAIAAGFAERSARTQAARLLQNDNVRAEIAWRMNKQAVKADEALSFLGEMMRIDLDDFMTMPGTFPYFDYEKARRLGKTRMIKKLKVHNDGMIEVEFHNAQKANETVLRALGLLKDGNTFIFNFDLSIELVIETIRELHEAGVNVSEFMEKARIVAQKRMADRVHTDSG